MLCGKTRPSGAREGPLRMISCMSEDSYLCPVDSNCEACEFGRTIAALGIAWCYSRRRLCDRATEYCECMEDVVTHHRLVAQLAMHLQRQRDVWTEQQQTGE